MWTKARFVCTSKKSNVLSKERSIQHRKNRQQTLVLLRKLCISEMQMTSYLVSLPVRCWECSSPFLSSDSGKISHPSNSGLYKILQNFLLARRQSQGCGCMKIIRFLREQRSSFYFFFLNPQGSDFLLTHTAPYPIVSCCLISYRMRCSSVCTNFMSTVIALSCSSKKKKLIK